MTHMLVRGIVRRRVEWARRYSKVSERRWRSQRSGSRSSVSIAGLTVMTSGRWSIRARGRILGREKRSGVRNRSGKVACLGWTVVCVLVHRGGKITTMPGQSRSMWRHYRMERNLGLGGGLGGEYGASGRI